MKKLLKTAIGLILGAAVSASAQTPPNVVLDNCVLKQNTHNRTVEVTYELTGDAPVYITLDITTNGVAIPVPEAVRGDITTVQTPNIIEPGVAPKIIRWEAKQDWPGNLTTQAQATVTAWFTNDPPARLKSYVVVDLSGGPAASSYDVRYSVEPPVLSDPACKTDELWLRRIPAGTFTMGSPDGELGRVATREAQHEVTLTKDFYIGMFQVTQKQWERVMGTTPVTVPAEVGNTRPVTRISYNDIRGATTNDTPVNWPTTGNVVAPRSFMDVLRAKTPFLFDLPTEAQWEYACRAGTTGAWNNGTTIATNSVGVDVNLNLLGQYNKTANTDHVAVGSFQPNAWRLYDMHGNVTEWCLDWSQDDLTSMPENDPPGGQSGTHRMCRGGALNSAAVNCRAASRATFYEPHTVANNRGFRVCIQPPEGYGNKN